MAKRGYVFVGRGNWVDLRDLSRWEEEEEVYAVVPPGMSATVVARRRLRRRRMLYCVKK
jgi:hypothetical protein